MVQLPKHRRNCRKTLLGSASIAIVAGLAFPTIAIAQSPTPPPAPETAAGAVPAQSDQGAADKEIVVTGTRIVRDGYRAPTPTSVIGEKEIANKAAANIADFVNELPALSGSTSPRANVGSLSTGLIGINALNLRNLGANRTLILLDGQRVATSNLGGLVDINTLPQALVKRVDVVTGGASADYGSDAVAGVVNFVLDKDFTGLKGQAQGGVTTYGDDRNYNVSLTAGLSFADKRGHVLLSGEIAHNDGITGIGDRSWYNYSKLFVNPAYNATTNNTVPQLLALPNSGFATATPGGIITTGPLKGTYFGPGGVPTQFNYGPIVSGNFMQGGDYKYADFAKTGDLDPQLNRQSIFGRASFDVTDHFEVFAQGSYSRATTRVASLTQFNFGNITIQPDNAFIPASIAARVTAPFSLGSLNQDLGPAIATSNRSSLRLVLGAKGDFEAIGSHWKWDAYAQHSVNNIYTDGRVTINARYSAAIDAVRNGSGAIVCRSTLTDPTNGCVPYNILGTGVASDAARNYVLGTTWGRTKLTQDVFAANLRGEPFSTWAGPVSIATGIEHRREAVSGSNDPLTTATLKPYFAGNFFASFGSYDVTEGYLEAVVPLAKDLSFAKSLDFNGAVRATSYSTSGYVTTWKLGMTYRPVQDITFRVTRSRDIRAPNLGELFQSGQSSTTSLVDPFRNNTSSTVSQVTSGNLALRPEKADTFGVGVVLTPSFLPGFAASVDYYNIKIRDAISTVNAASVVGACQQGNTASCAQITRLAGGPLINGLTAIGTVAVFPTNVFQQLSRGLDFEASYRLALAGGTVSLRGLATRFIENYDGSSSTSTVGTNGTNGTLRNSLPKWRYLATVGYDRDPVAVSFTARGFSAGVLNTSYVECTTGCPVSTAANMTVNNNQVPGATYFDGNITLKLPHHIETFFAVDNIANKDPAQVAFGTAIGAAPLSVNPLLYDVLGRTFRLGFRFKM